MRMVPTLLMCSEEQVQFCSRDSANSVPMVLNTVYMILFEKIRPGKMKFVLLHIILTHMHGIKELEILFKQIKYLLYLSYMFLSYLFTCQYRKNRIQY